MAMLILFIRAIILYLLVFMVIRLTGKRQISDLQPFDLIITLLVAESLTELMKGKLKLSLDGDLFKVELWFDEDKQ